MGNAQGGMQVATAAAVNAAAAETCTGQTQWWGVDADKETGAMAQQLTLALTLGSAPSQSA